MSSTTNIEWTDATWNPIRGCSRVSEGCRNCYAEKFAYRFSGPGQPYEGLAAKVNGHAAWTGEVRLIEEHLLDPLKWGHVPHHEDTGIKTRGKCERPGRPCRIFVNSMSDLFHENVPDEWIDRIFAVMALCPQHQFQILTKRPDRMLRYLTTRSEGNSYLQTDDGRLEKQYAAHDRVFADMVSMLKSVPAKSLNAAADWQSEHCPDGEGFLRAWPLPNVWMGVSVENQTAADERIPLLLQTPAAVRFISAEPLLGLIDLDVVRGNFARHTLSAVNYPGGKPWLDWAICGGESGPGARPMHPDWARSLLDQCQAAGVPFFFKQWGEWGPNWLNDENGKVPNSEWMDRMGKKAAGALLDGREWREFPEAPNGR